MSLYWQDCASCLKPTDTAMCPPVDLCRESNSDPRPVSQPPFHSWRPSFSVNTRPARNTSKALFSRLHPTGLLSTQSGHLYIFIISNHWILAILKTSSEFSFVPFLSIFKALTWICLWDVLGTANII